MIKKNKKHISNDIRCLDNYLIPIKDFPSINAGPSSPRQTYLDWLGPENYHIPDSFRAAGNETPDLPLYHLEHLWMIGLHNV